MPFKITGILDRTGTPVDRAAFVNMEGFFLIPDHAKGHVEEEHKPGEPVGPDSELGKHAALDIEFVVYRRSRFRQERTGNYHTQNLPRSVGDWVLKRLTQLPAVIVFNAAREHHDGVHIRWI